MRTERTAQVTNRDTQRLRLIRQGFSPAPGRCERCGEETKMLTPEEAAAFAGTEPQTINSLMLLGRLHGGETAEGAQLICFNSLRALHL